MKLLPLALSLPILLIASTGAGGQTLYRCPGQVYTEQPCPGGTAVAVPEGPTAQQRREATEAALRQARLAQQWAREREQREASHRPAAAVGIRGERGRPITPSPTTSQKANAPRKEGRGERKARQRPATPPA